MRLSFRQSKWETLFPNGIWQTRFEPSGFTVQSDDKKPSLVSDTAEKQNPCPIGIKEEVIKPSQPIWYVHISACSNHISDR